MRLPLALVVIAVALAGCGGGGDDDASDRSATDPSQERSAPTSSQGRAVAAWASAAEAYWDDFRNCGSSVTAERDFYASCTKKTRSAFRDAEEAALRAINRSRDSRCGLQRRRLNGVLARTGAALERAVLAFDRSNNAQLEQRPYAGPAPQQLFLRGQGELEEGTSAARSLSAALDTGC